MMTLRYAFALLLISIVSPALADDYLAVTPSGTAEMLFSNKPQAVVGILSGKCIDSRWTVISSTSNELVCESPLNLGQSILGQALMGNSYSTPPRRFFRFNIAEVNGISRVQASGWMELQMAFGQTKRTDFSGPEFQNNLLGFMFAAGGKYPVGTTFPNHAALGVEADAVQDGKYAGFRIKHIESGGPGEKAGFQIGDVVTRIAGKRFKNANDYLDATAKAAGTATYAVDFTRGGNAMTVTVDRAFRPPVTEAVMAKAAPPPPIVAASVADELGKLAKLRSDGVLTQAEFDAQKKKLLGE